MTQSDRPDTVASELDAFIRELRALETSNAETAPARSNVASTPAATNGESAVGWGLTRLCESLDELTPDADARRRLIEAAAGGGRLWRFAARAAELLDIGLEQARALLDRLDDPNLFADMLPGIAFCWVEGGPSVQGAVRGFIRVAAGTEFPEHEHLGDEHVLVLQGGFEDATRGLSFRPGDVDHLPAGSVHAFRVPPNGVDLVALVVTHDGLHVPSLDITVAPPP